MLAAVVIEHQHTSGIWRIPHLCPVHVDCGSLASVLHVCWQNNYITISSSLSDWTKEMTLSVRYVGKGSSMIVIIH